MSTDTVAAVKRELEEAFNKGNLAVLDEIIAEDYVSYDPAFPEPIRGREGLRELIQSYRTGMADLHVHVDDQIAEGDKVVTRWTATGRHAGDMLGVPATGRPLKIAGITIERFEDGLIVEDWVAWDALGLMRQLGVVPEMAS